MLAWGGDDDLPHSGAGEEGFERTGEYRPPAEQEKLLGYIRAHADAPSSRDDHCSGGHEPVPFPAMNMASPYEKNR